MDAVMNVAGKLVCITGGMGLLGSQWARALSLDSAQVFIIDAAYGRDVANREYVNEDLASLPRVPDALICAAAIDNPPGTNDNGPWANWENIVDVNLTGVKNCCEVIGGAMAERGSGSIILVSSIYGMVSPDNRRYEPDMIHLMQNGGLTACCGRTPFELPRGDEVTLSPDMATCGTPSFVKPIAYSATKAALYGLTKYLACLWGPRNVRVNAVSFGPMASDNHPLRFKTEMRRVIPLGRFAHPGEYDGIIQFLVSDDSSYITGANIVVDGGYTAW